MKNRETIRANERYRSVSRTAFQIGATLFGAGVVASYNKVVVTPEYAGWMFTGAGLIWGGWQVLGLLDSEDE